MASWQAVPARSFSMVTTLSKWLFPGTTATSRTRWSDLCAAAGRSAVAPWPRWPRSLSSFHGFHLSHVKLSKCVSCVMSQKTKQCASCASGDAHCPHLRCAQHIGPQSPHAFACLSACTAVRSVLFCDFRPTCPAVLRVDCSFLVASWGLHGMWPRPEVECTVRRAQSVVCPSTWQRSSCSHPLLTPARFQVSALRVAFKEEQAKRVSLCDQLQALQAEPRSLLRSLPEQCHRASAAQPREDTGWELPQPQLGASSGL